MEIGKRVMIPEPTGQCGEGSWCFFGTARQQGYLEMRKVGGYPNSLAYSVVLAFLESCAYFPDRGEVEASINTTLGGGKFAYPLENHESAKVSEMLELPDFQGLFVQQCEWFLSSFQISKAVDESLSNIRKLCELLQLSVYLVFDEVHQYSIELNTPQKVMIGVMNNICFILYSSLTKESFITLPCGHLQLRFSFLQLLQRNVGQHTLTDSDEPPLQVCSDCTATYTPELFGFVLAQTEGSYLFTVTQPLDPRSLHVLVCCSCRRQITQEELSQYCSCSNTVCVNCVIVQRTRPGSLYCPACSVEIEVTTYLEYFATSRANLRGKLPHPWNTEKQYCSTGLKEKKCYSCLNEYQISEFDNHQNCWVCSNCIRSLLAKNCGICPHCNLEFDDTRESFQHILESVGEKEERKEKKMKADHHPPQRTSKSTMPIIAEEQKEKESPPSTSGHCSQCRREIIDPIPFTLQDDFCTICIACLKQNARGRKCKICRLSYTPRDFTVLTEYIAQEVKYSECSYCHFKHLSSDLHNCVKLKKKCRGCCINEVITSFTSAFGQCKDCGAKLCEDIRIDVKEEIYMCSSCSNLKSLLEIVHKCNSQALYCRECMNFKNARSTKCKGCSKTIGNKHFGKNTSLPH